MRTLAIGLVLAAAAQAAPLQDELPELPELVVTEEGARIERSCRLVIPPGTVLRDEEGDGALHVVRDGVRVVFAPGTVLRGAPEGTPWDELTGTGLTIHGARGVTVIGARVHGYKVGIHGREAQGLTIRGADVSDNFRQRLGSTPEAADDGADWLAPHANDENEWTTRYGAGIWLEDTGRCAVIGSRGRRIQNGIVFDRVDYGRVVDCDFSFLSGWGLAMWRARACFVMRNAFDFCVRGYSHGVYNRGQDSAGILMFEQCVGNLVAENSVTHGGDGVFGFSGSEALGQRPGPEGVSYERLGNVRNTFSGNDLSYAAAHGLEFTFAFETTIERNRFVGNAICGLWGGYSQGTVVRDNDFERNGGAGYGLERGGANLEHAVGTLIASNRFRENACGVHLWWDPDEHLADLPWVQANGAGCGPNWIQDNAFDGDTLAVHLRGCDATYLGGNVYVDVARELEAEEGALAPPEARMERQPPTPGFVVSGETRPVGARPELRGRDKIVLTEWGPWDHESPLLRRAGDDGRAQRWSLLRFPAAAVVRVEGEGLLLSELEPAGAGERRFELRAAEPGLHPYRLVVEAGERSTERRGRLLRADWTVRCFPWTVDPREDREAWLAQAEGGGACVAEGLPRLALRFGTGGPAELGIEGLASPAVGRDRFGTLAVARVPLPAGRYAVETISDDGVRVLVDGAVVLEDWTWHAPRAGRGTFELERPATVELRVEHFELDGVAQLELSLAPLD